MGGARSRSWFQWPSAAACGAGRGGELVGGQFGGAGCGGGSGTGRVGERPGELLAQDLLGPGVSGDVVFDEQQVRGGPRAVQQSGPPAVFMAEAEAQGGVTLDEVAGWSATGLDDRQRVGEVGVGLQLDW